MYVISDDCISCGACQPECPVEAIEEGEDKYVITDACTDCGSCAEVCPTDAISPGNSISYIAGAEGTGYIFFKRGAPLRFIAAGRTRPGRSIASQSAPAPLALKL